MKKEILFILMYAAITSVSAVAVYNKDAEIKRLEIEVSKKEKEIDKLRIINKEVMRISVDVVNKLPKSN